MAINGKHYARRPFGYGAESRELDRGQVFEFEGLRNDEALMRLGYAEKLPKDTTLKECGACGGWFVDEPSRNSHYQKRHPATERTPDEEDRLIEQEEKQLEKVAPLYLDKTKASRGEKSQARA